MFNSPAKLSQSWQHSYGLEWVRPHVWERLCILISSCLKPRWTSEWVANHRSREKGQAASAKTVPGPKIVAQTWNNQKGEWVWTSKAKVVVEREKFRCYQVTFFWSLNAFHKFKISIQSRKVWKTPLTFRQSPFVERWIWNMTRRSLRPLGLSTLSGDGCLWHPVNTLCKLCHH